MFPSSDKRLPTVGAYWVETADHAAALGIFDDSDTLRS